MEADQGDHAQIELVIRDLKDAGLAHVPSGRIRQPASPEAWDRRRLVHLGRARSCDRVEHVGWHVGPFQGDEVAGVRDLGELGVGELSPVGLPV